MQKVKWSLSFVLFCCLFLFCACNNQEKDIKKFSYKINYITKENTEIVELDYATNTEDETELIKELLAELMKQPEKTELRATIPSNLKLDSYKMEDKGIVLDFQAGYYQLPKVGEVLSRAAIVKTLTQLDAIDYVTFTVSGKELLDDDGKPVGVMTNDQFMNNAGNEINTFEKANLVLYFSDASGKLLRSYNKSVVYNSNISMEKLIVEQLILGPPSTEYGYPVINPKTKLNSIIVKDGICYIDLNETFSTQVNNASAEVAVYSLVNSLIELPNVNKVQIAINGETDLQYREALPLSSIFERNLEIIY